MGSQRYNWRYSAMKEKRNYEKNGLSHLYQDNKFLEYCLNCDLRGDW
jgi:hypothetical protein